MRRTGSMAKGQRARDRYRMAETANPTGEGGSGALIALEPIPAFAGRAKSYVNIKSKVM